MPYTSIWCATRTRIGSIVTFIHITTGVTPEVFDTVEVITEVHRRTIDQVTWVKVIPPGIAIYSYWRHWWLRWVRLWN